MAASSRTRKPRRHRLRDGADLPRGHDRNEPIYGVGKSDGDQVPELHAILQQLPGKGVGPCLKLGSGHAVFAARDGGSPGSSRSVICQPVGERDDGHGRGLR